MDLADPTTIGRIAKDAMVVVLFHSIEILPAINALEQDAADMKALDTIVVFRGVGHLAPKFYLHREFQHCFAYVRSGNSWRVIESTREGLITNQLSNVDIRSIVGVNTEKGAKVLVGTRYQSQMIEQRQDKATNCVETLKRILQISHLRFILTPLQLYWYLVLYKKMKLMGAPDQHTIEGLY